MGHIGHMGLLKLLGLEHWVHRGTNEKFIGFKLKFRSNLRAEIKKAVIKTAFS